MGIDTYSSGPFMNTFFTFIFYLSSTLVCLFRKKKYTNVNMLLIGYELEWYCNYKSN